MREALTEAQLAGFAESDPTDDVDGLDAGAKLAILARVGLKAELRPQQVLCNSIRSVAAVDFEYAAELGCTIRQISTAKRIQRQLYAEVGPALVRKDSPLARISGGQNIVVSTGEFGGDTVFSGHGAGGNPTAVAVVSDLLQAARHRASGVERQCHPAAHSYEVMDDTESQQYVRFVVRDRPGILASLAGAFSRHHINVDAVLQRPGYSKSKLAFVMTLESCRKSRLQAALAEIGESDFLAEASTEPADSERRTLRCICAVAIHFVPPRWTCMTGPWNVLPVLTCWRSWWTPRQWLPATLNVRGWRGGARTRRSMPVVCGAFESFCLTDIPRS